MSSYRLISLLPAATEIVCALGLRDRLVGRSHECDFPPGIRNLPACSSPAMAVDGPSYEIDRLVKDQLAHAASIYRIDSTLLRDLQPTHLLTQTLCDVCAVSPADVAAALQQQTDTAVALVTLSAGSLHGLWEDIRNVGHALSCTGAAEQLISRMREEMNAIHRQVTGVRNRPRVAAIEWLDPLMAAGNWIPELIELADGENLFGSAGHHSPWMDWDSLCQADPDVIIGLPCGFDLTRTHTEMAALSAHREWSGLSAVRSNQVFLCDGNQFMNRPGPRLVESLRIFAEILHPSLFHPTLQDTGWVRYSPTA